MLQDRLKVILQDLGLGDREAKIYLALLELGQATISELAKKTRLERTSCYGYLQRLAELGLIAEDFRKYGKKITPLPLKKVVALLERRQRKLRRRSLELQDLIPVIEKQYKLKVQMPKIRYFEGLDGAREIYWDSLSKAGITILNYTSADDCLNYIPKLIKEYVEERSRKHIKVKVLTSQLSAETLKYMEETSQPSGREYKVLPKGFDLTSEYLIYQDKVANISLNPDPDKIWGTIIQDKELARNQKKIFNLVWKLV